MRHRGLTLSSGARTQTTTSPSSRSAPPSRRPSPPRSCSTAATTTSPSAQQRTASSSSGRQCTHRHTSAPRCSTTGASRSASTRCATRGGTTSTRGRSTTRATGSTTATRRPVRSRSARTSLVCPARELILARTRAHADHKLAVSGTPFKLEVVGDQPLDYARGCMPSDDLTDGRWVSKAFVDPEHHEVESPFHDWLESHVRYLSRCQGERTPRHEC